MFDCYQRTINYLRVSVTDRCNFRCMYCMPSQGVQLLDHSDILSYEEFIRLLEVFSRQGIQKIRLTGGEPLVRKGLTDFIRNIAAIEAINDISLTTNGCLLAPMAEQLKNAGLNRVNISLDTVDAKKFRRITRGGDVADTLRGVAAALEVGLTPVKLNTVLTELLTMADLEYFVDLVQRHPVNVRFIEYMPIGECRVGAGPSVEEVKTMLEQLGHGLLTPVSAPTGNGPARYYQLPGAKGTLGFVTPISEHFCSQCNRVRLTADGKLKPCLLSDQEIDLKAALRSGASEERLVELFQQTVAAKPEGHSLTPQQGKSEVRRRMSQIGG
ncbi:MAG TPA: GTP 3',8-cyclase MoaA [Patescibacteria group bacterium]|nr:GTP 3',8-cyclase MoaA [Patescibacteria group bacterium]